MNKHGNLSLIEREQLNDYLDGYIPINYTSWWRKQWASSFLLAQSIGTLVLLAVILLYWFWLNYCSLTYIDHVETITEHMSRSGCTIWLTESQRVVILREADIGWTLFGTLGEFTTLLPTIFIVILAFSTIYLEIVDLLLATTELNFLLMVALELGKFYTTKADRLQPVNSVHNQVTSFNEQKNNNLSEIIREKIYETVELSKAILIVKPLSRLHGPSKSKLDTKIAYYEFASSLISRFGLNPDVYIEILAKIHVNLSNLVMSVSQINPRTANGLVFSYIINFVVLAVSVYFNQHTKNLTVIPLSITLISISSVNLFISFASNLHCKYKRVEAAFWSLIALNAHSEDVRVKHLVDLWNRQIGIMSEDGGLALKISDLNITYGAIIHLLAWTSTILLFAYTH